MDDERENVLEDVNKKMTPRVSQLMINTRRFLLFCQLMELHLLWDYDLRPFHKLHRDVTYRFKSLCTEWRDKLSLMEIWDTGQPSEDKLLDNIYVAMVMDDIRTTIIQVKLLISGKLQCYLDLVKQVEIHSI